MTQTLERAFVKIEGDTSHLRRELRRMDRTLVRSSRQASRRFDGLNRTLQNTGNHFRTARRLALAFGGALAIGAFIRSADTYKLMEARLGGVSDSQEEARATLERLFEVAQDTRNEFEATATLYTRTARATRNLGTSQRDLLTFVQATNQAIQISGANAQEATGGITQLSQALQSGQLQGDELRSVRENLGRLFEAIIEGIQTVNPGLNLTRENFKKLAAEGKITSALIIDALVSQAPKLEREFAKIPSTVGQAMTKLGNSFTRAIGLADETSGATQEIVESIENLRESVESAGFQRAIAALFGTMAFGAELAAEQMARLGDVLDKIEEKMKEIDGADVDMSAFLKDSFRVLVNPFGAILDAIEKAGQAKSSGIVIDLATIPNETETGGSTKRRTAAPGSETKEAKKIREMIEALGRQAEQTRFMSEAATIGAEALEKLNVQIEIQEALIDAGLIPATTSLAESMFIAANAENAQANQIGNLIEEIDRYTRVTDEAEDAQDVWNDLLDEGKALTEAMRTPLEAYADEMARLNRLLDAGAIGLETFDRALDEARQELEQATPLAADLGFALAHAFEDAITRAESFRDVLKNLAMDLSRIGLEKFALGPLEKSATGFFDDLFSPSGGGLDAIAAADVFNPANAGIFHGGGVVGSTAVPTRVVPADIFANAPRFHFGGDVGRMPNLRPNERAIITKVGERISPAGQAPSGGDTFNITINATAARGATTSHAFNQGQQLARAFQAMLIQHQRKN